LEHVVCMGEVRNTYTGLVRKPEGKRPLERLSHRWDNNITISVKEIVCEDVE